VKKTTKVNALIVGLATIATAALSGCSREESGQQANAPQTSGADQASKDDSMAGMSMPDGDAAAGATHNAAGKIESIDHASSTVKIAHGEVPSLKWPAMSMDFKVEDPAVLGTLKEGETVNFSFSEKSTGTYTISQITSQQ
jgi:Cu/Ag efflux protein CusF